MDLVKIVPRAEFIRGCFGDSQFFDFMIPFLLDRKEMMISHGFGTDLRSRVILATLEGLSTRKAA